MIKLIYMSLAVYALTFLIVSSAILAPIRNYIGKRTMFLVVGGSHPLSCRMCAGLWISIITCLILGVTSPIHILAVYGLSYFIATQERR